MSTGNKERRTIAKSGAKAPSATADAEKAPLTRLNELLADALATANAVKPERGDAAAIKKAHRLASSLLKALPVDVTVKSIGYEGHKASLDKGLKALQKAVRSDWHDGWEEHGDMEEEMAEEIMEWLPDLWRHMAEDDVDVKLVEQALVLCSVTVRGIENCGSRAGFDERSFEITITDSDGKTVYNGRHSHINHSLAWMWRELLVLAASQNKPTKAILADVKRFKYTDDVFDLIQTPGEETNRNGYQFWDAHWSQAMKDCADQLCATERPQSGNVSD